MFDNVTADLRHYSRYCFQGQPVWKTVLRALYAHPASAAVIWYRLGSAAWRVYCPGVRQLLQAVYLLGLPLIRLYSGVQVHPEAVIGPGLAILHFGGVVIARGTQIGRNCLLHHNVNIVAMRGIRGAHIGDNFYAGVGATVIEAVIIEDNVTAGAGTIITKSVPEDAVVAGVPARILRLRQHGENPAENKSLGKRPAAWLRYPGEVPPRQMS